MAQDAGNKVIFGKDGKAYVYPADAPEARALPGIGEGSFQEVASKSLLDALEMQAGNSAVGAVLGLGVKGLNLLKNGAGNLVKVFDEGSSLGLGASNQNLAANGANAAGSTGTVFDSIAATQSVYPGSIIPRSFEMALPNGQRVWVAGNATEQDRKSVV